MRGCGEVDVFPFEQYTVTFKDWRLAYDPQMLLSIMAVSNSIEDQTVRMVAPASKTDDAIPPTEVPPGRTGGVSFVCRSCRRLFSPLLRVLVSIDGMASNNYVLSGHFFI